MRICETQALSYTTIALVDRSQQDKYFMKGRKDIEGNLIGFTGKRNYENEM